MGVIAYKRRATAHHCDVQQKVSRGGVVERLVGGGWVARVSSPVAPRGSLFAPCCSLSLFPFLFLAILGDPLSRPAEDTTNQQAHGWPVPCLPSVRDSQLVGAASFGQLPVERRKSKQLLLWALWDHRMMYWCGSWQLDRSFSVLIYQSCHRNIAIEMQILRPIQHVEEKRFKRG
jgi:hypothetical protein